MNILITAGASALAHDLAETLAAEHDVRLTDVADAPGPWPFTRCALGHDAETDRLVAGVDALVHLAALHSENPASKSEDAESAANRLLDYHTRRTYNLLLAASAAGVSRCVYASSLALFANCDENWAIDEQWRPRPSTEPPVLARHLGEFVCREFAREGRIPITCLRLGNLGEAGASAPPPADPTRLAHDDAVRAFARALAAPPEPWAVYHIQSEFPGARFSTAKARDGLGFTPRQGNPGSER